jgi:hypothetical protein
MRTFLLFLRGDAAKRKRIRQDPFSKKRRPSAFFANLFISLHISSNIW